MRPFKRKTKADRERDRAEGTWMRYQQTEMVAPLLATEEELLAQGYRVVPVPTDVTPCDKHPQWTPARWLATQPRASAEGCPYCQAERTKPKPEFREDAPIVHHPHWESSYKSERALAAIDAWKDRQADRDPINVPGTSEHEQAIALIDERRALAKERRKYGRSGGQLVCQRIERGELVQYVDVRASIHDRPVIVRVGP